MKTVKSIYKSISSKKSLSFTKPLIKLISHDYPNARVLLVGGVIRDLFLGRPGKDYDLVVTGVPDDELNKYLIQFGKVDCIAGRNFGVRKFKPNGSNTQIDIAVPRSETYAEDGRAHDLNVQTKGLTIKDDFSRRDFTINALGLDLKSGELIDPFNGFADLNARIIRAVGDSRKRFSEDPTRILRAIRFAVKLDFKIEDKTWQALANQRNEIVKPIPGSDPSVARVAMEKVGEEFAKTFEHDPVRTVEYYDQAGLLEMFFPELTANKRVPQPLEFHSEGDSFEHAKLALSNLPADASFRVKIATLLHDTGKANTFASAQETGDRIRFNNHDKISAEIAKKILYRLKFDRKLIDDVCWLIKHHLSLTFAFPQMRLAKQKDFAAHPLFGELIRLVIADAKASLNPQGKTNLDFLKQVNEILETLAKEKKAGKPREIINGDEIIQLFSKQLKRPYDSKFDGPKVGEVKQFVNDEFNEGKIETKEDALNLAAQRLKKD